MFYVPPTNTHVIPVTIDDAHDDITGVDGYDSYNSVTQYDSYGYPHAPAIVQLQEIIDITDRPVHDHDTIVHTGDSVVHAHDATVQTAYSGVLAQDNIEDKETDFKQAEEFSIIINLPQIVLDEVIDLTSDMVNTNDVAFNTTNENSDTEQPNIPQKPSAGFPDQNKPDKYLNTEIETLSKVINNPVFYKDTERYKENFSLKF